MSRESIVGILNVNKPTGMTSRAAVDRVARLVKPAKVGHAGTLDPLASGVLVICIGQATRLVQFIHRQPKHYRARFLLGKRSDTDDVTGKVVDVPVESPVSRKQIESLLPRFVGRISQVPPQFSAVHVEGQRAYRLARQGRRVSIEAKAVEIHRLSVTEFRYPQLELEIECGSGTYVRSLGRDLGELLGCGAVMSELVRTQIVPFCLEAAIEANDLDHESLLARLIPAQAAVADFPSYICSSDELNDVACGRPVTPRPESEFAEGQTVVMKTSEDELACLAEYRCDKNALAPKQVFLARG